MQRATLSAVILGLLVLGFVGVLDASEADVLRERANAMQKEASILAERGNNEQAERLKKESIKVLEAAEQLELKAKGREKIADRNGIEVEIQLLKDRLQVLVSKEKKLRETQAPVEELAEVRKQIAGTERELRAIHAQHAGHGKLPAEFQAQAEKLEAASRRIHHFRIAAENLKLAEAHDLAQQLMEKAEAMEREVQNEKKRLASEIQKIHGGMQGPDIMRELKEEIERLRTEVKELRQKVEKR